MEPCFWKNSHSSRCSPSGWWLLTGSRGQGRKRQNVQETQPTPIEEKERQRERKCWMDDNLWSRWYPQIGITTGHRRNNILRRGDQPVGRWSGDLLNATAINSRKEEHAYGKQSMLVQQPAEKTMWRLTDWWKLVLRRSPIVEGRHQKH